MMTVEKEERIQEDVADCIAALREVGDVVTIAACRAVYESNGVDFRWTAQHYVVCRYLLNAWL